MKTLLSLLLVNSYSDCILRSGSLWLSLLSSQSRAEEAEQHPQKKKNSFLHLQIIPKNTKPRKLHGFFQRIENMINIESELPRHATRRSA